MDSIIRLGGIKYKNKIAGPWDTTTIYTQGCYKNCKGCFNQGLRQMLGGKELTIYEIIEDLIEHTPNKKVCFCGGEPMIWAKQLAEVARKLRSKGFTVICYTGYEWEDLIEPTEWITKYLPNSKELATAVDILIVGEFIEDLQLEIDDYKFVGSSNQRVIDVAKTLKKGEVVLFEDQSEGGKINE